MALTNDLISQFVKITNDKKEKKTETTVYGTTVEQDGKMYVQIDGSDLLTPVTSTTNNASGERVMVMIKNHTATITGNITSPSAKNSDVQANSNQITEFGIVLATKADVEDLVAANAQIENLIAEDALIKGDLLAANARIDELDAGTIDAEEIKAIQADITSLKTDKLDAKIAEATYATITNLETTDAKINNLNATYGEFASATADKFEAIDAAIENLDASNITVDYLEGTYATIEDLDVERGRIDELNAEVADIDTLIFGSATGTTIQTSFANAVIAQLGDAQIKSAMIENVSASKITSGDVITNNVRVVSEDGKLLISDETIQISDSTRVRVQIGKDSSGDYSINIWDADGNLMFSEGGITDSAIKEAIIRNDMVSDTANIAAHKLDIDSLFEEINGSTNTIKSTQIYLDDEGQTLDVAFKELTTEVTEQGETVSSQGTSISVIQGQIESKIWQQDINTATNEMSTQYSTLSQDLTGFKASVGSTYATKSELGDIIVGGRNLILNTSDPMVVGTTEEFVASTKTKNYKFNNDIVSDNRAFLLSLENNYLLLSYDVDIPAIYDNTAETLNRVGAYFTVEFTEIATGVKTSWYGTHSSAITGQGSTIGEQKNSSNSLLSLNASSESPTSFVGHYCGYCDMSINSGSSIIRNFYTNPDAYDVFLSPNLITEIRGYTTGGEIKNIKLEIGNKPTDWSPAPEDFQNGIENLETSVSVLNDKVTTNINATDSLGVRTTALEQTSTSITTRVSNVETEVDEISVGGRNLFGFNKGAQISPLANTALATPVFDESIKGFHITILADTTENVIIARVSHMGFDGIAGPYTFSAKVYSNVDDINLAFDICDRGNVVHTIGTTPQKISLTAIPTNYYDSSSYNGFIDVAVGNGTTLAASTIIYLEDVKIERGNRATDWTPAPEDMATDDDVSTLESSIESAEERITTSETLIQQLSDSIMMLVTDGNGESLMVQTENGWTFSTGELQSIVDSTSESLNDLTHEVGDVSATVNVLQQAVDDLGVLADYVKITTYEDEPCIELGEIDSDFKLLITNTRILFMEGSSMPAYITNQSLHIKKAVIEEELQQGEFIWKARSNGNLGLIWKGVTS